MIVLQQIQVNKPCHASWDAMTGTAQERFCTSCQKTVHNLSAMTTEEAQTLLTQSEAKICVRFTRTQEGQIQTVSHETQAPQKKKLSKPKKIVKPSTVKPHTRPIRIPTTGFITPNPPPAPEMGFITPSPPPVPEHTMGEPMATPMPSQK